MESKYLFLVAIFQQKAPKIQKDHYNAQFPGEMGKNNYNKKKKYRKHRFRVKYYKSDIKYFFIG